MGKRFKSSFNPALLLLAVALFFVVHSFSEQLKSSSNSVNPDSTAQTVYAHSSYSSSIPTSKPTAKPTSVPTATVTPAYSSLRLGSTGEDVKRLQNRLNALGFSVGTADGSYGAKTEHAVKEFQKSAGLTADGVAGKKTQAALYAAYAPSAPSSYRVYSGSSVSAGNSSAGSNSNSNQYNEPVKSSYVGNRNTGKFHHSWCSSVKQMKNSNRVSLSSRSEAISRGYSPCKRCDP